MWAARGSPCAAALAWASESAVHCRTSGSVGSILLAQHAKEGDNRNHCHKQIIPGGGGHRPCKVFSSLSLLLLVWETGAKPPSGKGNGSAQTSWSNKSPWSAFQTGSFSSSHPLCHPSLCHTYKHPDLEDESKMCLHQMCLSSLFTPIQTALAFFLPLQSVLLRSRKASRFSSCYKINCLLIHWCNSWIVNYIPNPWR